MSSLVIKIPSRQKKFQTDYFNSQFLMGLSRFCQHIKLTWKKLKVKNSPLKLKSHRKLVVLKGGLKG